MSEEKAALFVIKDVNAFLWKNLEESCFDEQSFKFNIK